MNTVYHYCSAETFLNIIKHKKLWLGDIRYMNDYLEMKWCMNAFRELLETDLSDSQYKAIYENTADNQSTTKPYISCLSQSGDILSQWRAYAQDGHGIALGLDSSKLDVRMDSPISVNRYIKKSFFLNKVSYLDNESVKALIIKIIESHSNAVNFFADENSDFAASSRDLQNEIVSLGNMILHISLHIKNPAFSEEQEIRLIYNHLPMFHHLDDKKNSTYHEFLKSKTSRISQGNLTSHYEFPIPIESISEIILGPKCNFDIDDVQDFINSQGLRHDVKIHKSQASYR